MKFGGCISHHHGILLFNIGVGKLRKKFLSNSIGETGINMLKGLKNTIDPTNVFACGNLI
jgi:alkyldihydroxyacetonephosphate synthase